MYIRLKPAHFIAITLIVCLMPVLAVSGGIKERMRSRIPALKVLKAEGIIGENNRGYLEFRAPETQKQLVMAENADRKTVYQAIAKKQGATLELVEQLRARQIAEKALPGVWIQLPDGTWKKK
ncbi:MAG: hypothetical protein CSA22_00355 [Deltaproteobacteria bacterium]|nr:MAG: hypothetical protein CSA22_00355 [Deltaproteobacteria bacterium]